MNTNYRYIHFPRLLAGITRFKDFRLDFNRSEVLDDLSKFWLVGYYEHTRPIDDDDFENSEQRVNIVDLMHYACPKLEGISYAYRASAATTVDELLSLNGNWSQLYPDASEALPYIWVRSRYTFSNGEFSDYYHITDKYAGRDSSVCKVTGTKTWIGFDEEQPNPVLVLKREAVGVPLETVIAEPEWDNGTYIYSNLPTFAENQYPYSYYVYEVDDPSYESFSYNTESGSDFVNVSLEEISVTVNKIWETAGQEIPEETCYFKIYGRSKSRDHEVATVQVNSSDNWSATVYHLRKYDEYGEINYTAEEVNQLAGWDTTYEKYFDEEGNIIIDVTNTYNDGSTKTITVTKFWSDAQVNHPNVSISVSINGNEEVITLGQSNDWTWTRSGVDSSATVVVNEITTVAGYTPSITWSNNNCTIYNYKDSDTAHITINKVWSDSTNDPITAYLSINGATPVTITVPTTGWVSNEEYPLGTEVNIEEEPVQGYTYEVSNDGGLNYTITNTKESPDPPTTDTLTITKQWNLTTYNAPPVNAVSVYVSIDGVTSNVELSSENNWTYSREGVSALSEISVTEETTLTDFTTTYSHSGLNWVIINTEEPSPTEPLVQYTENINNLEGYPWKDASTEFPVGTPKTDRVTHYMQFSILKTSWTSGVRVSTGSVIENNKFWGWKDGSWSPIIDENPAGTLTYQYTEEDLDYYTFTINDASTHVDRAIVLTTP